MRIETVSDDLRIFIGDKYDSNSAILIHGREALLIDAVGSTADAKELSDYIRDGLGARVRFIISTHYFSDHMAALRVFPDAEIIAHRNFRQTFDAEEFRSAEEGEFFVEPHVVIDSSLVMRWGALNLNVFHNPGHTPATLNVDIPEADLVLTSDTFVGNIAYFRYGHPEDIAAALERIRSLGRSRAVASHGGTTSSEAVEHALFYLRTLRNDVRYLRRRSLDVTIPLIKLNSCLPQGVKGTDFENIFHKRNLDVVTERSLFLNEEAA